MGHSSLRLPSFHTQIPSCYFIFSSFLWTVPIKIFGPHQTRAIKWTIFLHSRNWGSHFFPPDKVILKLLSLSLYSWPLNSMGLNYTSPLTYGFFSPVNTVGPRYPWVLVPYLQLNLWMWNLQIWRSNCGTWVSMDFGIHSGSWNLSFTDIVFLLCLYLLDNEMKNISLSYLYHLLLL